PGVPAALRGNWRYASPGPRHMMPRMKGVSRYIAKQIAVVAVFVTFALTAAVWLSQSLRFVDMIINHGLPLGLSLYFLALMMPSLLVLVLPVSLFIAVIFVDRKSVVQGDGAHRMSRRG